MAAGISLNLSFEFTCLPPIWIVLVRHGERTLACIFVRHSADERPSSDFKRAPRVRGRLAGKYTGSGRPEAYCPVKVQNQFSLSAAIASEPHLAKQTTRTKANPKSNAEKLL